jgi:NADH:ubiquinone oxidoreductase subunit 3 (subunit A)
MLTLRDIREIARLRADSWGFNVGAFAGLVIGIIVVVIIVASLMGTLKTNLTKYAANESTFGPTMQTVVPLLIGVSILLAIVYVLLERRATE